MRTYLRTHRSTIAGILAVALVAGAVLVGSNLQAKSTAKAAAESAAKAAAESAAKAAAGIVADSQLQGCERGKLDRTAIAAALRAQAIYLNQVLDAASVKADVKTAARANQAVQDLSASSLESRTGRNLICAQVVGRP